MNAGTGSLCVCWSARGDDADVRPALADMFIVAELSSNECALHAFVKNVLSHAFTFYNCWHTLRNDKVLKDTGKI